MDLYQTVEAPWTALYFIVHQARAKILQLLTFSFQWMSLSQQVPQSQPLTCGKLHRVPPKAHGHLGRSFHVTKKQQLAERKRRRDQRRLGYAKLI